MLDFDHNFRVLDERIERLRRQVTYTAEARWAEVTQEVLNAYDAAKRYAKNPCYADLAALHGADWAKVRHAMPGHLWAVVQWSHAQGGPMLSAVVVNKQHLETGWMEPETLRGFIGAAEELYRRCIADHVCFLRDQQERCFEWAKRSATLA